MGLLLYTACTVGCFLIPFIFLGVHDLGFSFCLADLSYMYDKSRISLKVLNFNYW